MSQGQFVPYGPYIDIINAVGKWKVVDLKSLSELCSYKLNYSNLRKKVRKLEDFGLVKSVNLGRKRKHLFLTNSGIKFTQYDQTYELCDESLSHDVIVGNVLRSFLGFPNFVNGRMFHEIPDNDLAPDALVTGIKTKREYELAIEVELTQKSSTRVKSKYSRYLRSKSFDYCIFITNKEGLFRTYKRFLGEMNTDVQSKIILMYAPDLSPNEFSFYASECHFKGQTKKFEEIFGE